MKKIQFSALICLYRNNNASEVQEALQSALVDQTRPPAELIVVFDGPVPSDVEAILSKFSSSLPTKLIRFKENKGHGPARAAGVAAASYEWLALIDADDISLSNRFEILLEAIQKHPLSAVIGGGLIEFTETASGREMGSRREYPQTPDEVKTFLRSRSPVAQPTAMLRVAAVLSVGNYETWFNNEDYHLWIRLVSAGYTIRNISEPVILFRTNPALFYRRGGMRYWWNEVKLQYFSFRKGTTTFFHLLLGASVRFVVQVLMISHIRAIFYKYILR